MRLFLLTRLSLLLWLVLTSVALHAQYNLTRTYTVQDGLPFTEAIKCLAASDGKLYFFTNAGHMMAFDGVNFEQLNLNELTTAVHPASTIAMEDRYGVWLGSGEHLFLLQNGKVSKVKVASSLNKFLLNEQRELIWVDSSYQVLRYQAGTNTFVAYGSLLPAIRSVGDPDYFELRFDQNNYWLLFRDSLEVSFQVAKLNNRFQLQSRPSLGGTVRNWLAFSDGSNFIKNHNIPDLPNDVLARYTGGHLQLLQGKDWNGQLRDYFRNYTPFYTQGHLYIHGRPPAEYALSEDDVEIWELKENGWAELIVRVQVRAQLNSLSPQLDQAGNFWLPAQSGLVKVFPAFLGCFESHPNMVSGLHAINEDSEGNIFLGSYRNGYAVFDGDHIVRPTQLNPIRFMPGSWRDKTGTMYFLKEDPYGFLISDGQHWRISPPAPGDKRKQMIGYYLTPVRQGERLAFGLSASGIGIMDPPFVPGSSVQYIAASKGMDLTNVLTIAEDRSGRLWYGRHSQGIGVYDPKLDTAVTWQISNQKDLGAISSLVDSRGNLWLGTQDGLAFLSEPDRFDFLHENVNHYLQLVDLPQVGRGLVTFLKEYRGQLIFGNNRGFGLLDLESFYDDTRPRVRFFPTDHYLPGGGAEQNAVYVDTRGKVWMGTDLGAIRMDLDRLPPDTSIIRFHSLLFHHGDDDHTPAKKRQLSIIRGQRYLRFSWAPELDHQLHPNSWLSYQLIMESGDTAVSVPYTTDREITLGYIAPGHHDFSVKLFKNNQLQESRQFDLYIPPNLEETWWFWALLSTFVIGAVAGIMGLIYRNKRQQQRHELATARLNQEKEELQVQAITSSLNPHFLNNTLHWVQARVRKDRTAGDVIDRLAANIRTVFSQSRNKQAFHTLWDELILVENYLKIQGERFRDRYRYTLPDDKTRLRFRRLPIPLMQLQIHVENAIEHGLRHRKDSSGLTVRLEEESLFVLLIVEDDGIGYSNAQRLKIHHTQQGTHMLNNLHHIYNQKNQYKITTEIEDNIYLDSTTHTTYGTRIVVRIPKTYHYVH